MKKFLAFILALAMLFGFGACDKKSDSDDDGGSDSKIPSNVLQAVEDCCEDERYSVGSLKVEYEWSGEVTHYGDDETCHEEYYLLSGRITAVDDEEDEDYKGGYVIFSVRVDDGDESECYSIGLFEKSEKEDFEEILELRVDEFYEYYKTYQGER